MKKLILILILIGLSRFSNAQNSFPTGNAIWNEQFYHGVGASSQYVIYGLLGDTIIDGTQYNKLYELSDTILSIENTKGYVGGFRQEEGKVFFQGEIVHYEHIDMEIFSNGEILIYDFTASIGDTVWFNKQASGHHCIIDDIKIQNDKKILSGLNSRGVFFNWHEGIGNIGLFQGLSGMPLTWEYWSLACFKHNDTVKYISNSRCNNQCFCPVVNIQESVYSELINIYPNPTKDILNIEIPENTKAKSINIYSMDGKLMSTYPSDTKQINISSLKEGSYIVNIETDKGNLNKTIIKK